MNKKHIDGRLGRTGALKRHMPLAVMLIAVLAAVMANYAFSADTIYDAVSAGNYVDVGLDKSKGISMNLVEKGLTHKVLEFEIDSEISSQEIQLLIAENNFDAKEGSLTRLEIVQTEEPVYETLCNPYNLPEDPINHSIDTVQNCTTMQIGTKNVDVEEWMPVELKSSEKNNADSLASFNILGKGRYRYSFDTPIIQTASGWGNKGTVFLKVGSDLYADKQHSSWWDGSCSARIGTTATPSITDTNMQLYINLSKDINWKYAYVIRNDIKATLAWINNTQQAFFTNLSVTAGTQYDIVVYYNCSASTQQYNVTQVMLKSSRFESQEDANRWNFEGGTPNAFNNTFYIEGVGSVNGNTDDSRFTFNGTLSNVTIETNIHIADISILNRNHKVISANFHVGKTDNSATNVSYYAGTGFIVSPIPLTIGWHKVKYIVNATGTTAYWDNEQIAVYAGATSATKISFGNDPNTLDDNYDVVYIYRNYGANNPTYEVGEVEIRDANSSEAVVRDNIQAAIFAKLPSAAIYTDQQIYVRYLNGTQMIGSFDKVAAYGNQRWAFNYITGNETYTYLPNLEPSLYVWENTSLYSDEIEDQVGNLIDTTLA